MDLREQIERIFRLKDTGLVKQIRQTDHLLKSRITYPLDEEEYTDEEEN